MSYTSEKKLRKLIPSAITNMVKEHQCWLAGGSLLSILMDQPVNDYDIFFASKKEAYDFYTDLGGCRLLSETTKSIVVQWNQYKLNIIYCDFYPSAKDVCDSFDFTVCKIAFDGEDFYYAEHFWEDFALRRLVYTPSFRYPIATLLRVKKYEGKGFSISRNELIKICLMVTQHKVSSLQAVSDELGSIYGIDINKIYPKDEEFSLNRFIEIISGLDFDVTTELPQSNTVNDYFIKTFKEFRPIIEINDGYVFYDDFTLDCVDEDDYPKVEFPVSFYKVVQKRGDRLFSYYKNTFEYVAGDHSKDVFGVYVYKSEEDALRNMYAGRNDAVLVKLICYDPTHIVVSSHNVLRIKEYYVDSVTDISHCSPLRRL